MTSATGNKAGFYKARQGFSLIEIILVVALIALVSGMIVSNISVIADRGGEKSTQEIVQEAIRAARFEAARNRAITSLSFDNETGQLKIGSDNSESSEGNTFDLGDEFARGGRGNVRFYLVSSSEGLGAPEDASRTQMETKVVRFAPDRSSSPFVLELDYGFGTPERYVFDPFSSLRIKQE